METLFPIITLILAGAACLLGALALWQAVLGRKAVERMEDQTYQMFQNSDKLTKERLQYIANGQAQLHQTMQNQNQLVNRQLQGMTLQTEQRLENIRDTMENRLAHMQRDNNTQLTQMRQTVDEKLQKTLDEKLNRSFGLVSRQLEAVYKGLGEMQSLASGVGDLKKVLSGVKTRGILGEVQLEAILEQLLSGGQYAKNIATVPGSTERVEFALCLPGDGEAPVYLPIDAKFPLDAYNTLLDAYDTAEAAKVEAAAKAMEHRLRAFARDIHQKYIKVPCTTEFGIMFLPVEGLYAEVVRRGIADRLQQEFRVMVAGPTTMSALLNSLQMGFRTLAIQERSSEVWQVLGAVRDEFDSFGAALIQAQNRINQAGNDLENLVGVRTRQMQRKLKAIGRMEADTGRDNGALPLE